MRGRTVAAAATAALLAAACGGPEPGGGPGGEVAAPALDSLRAEVSRGRAELEARVARDSVLGTALGYEGDVVVGLATDLVTRMLQLATVTYLDDVRLHVEPDVVVREGEDVRVSVGPVDVRAGRWDVRVTVERVDAVLAVDTVELTVADSNRIEIGVPVRIEEGSGQATIDFTWDATTAASVMCRDFAVRESFRGTVSPYDERLEAALVLEPEGSRVVARPSYTGDRLTVRPEPTPEAWRRVRRILERQNSIFRCGLAISPDELERLLRRLLREGFRFEFPESVLRTVALPTVVTEEVTIAGRRFIVAVRPGRLRLDPDRLWYAVDLELRRAGG